MNTVEIHTCDDFLVSILHRSRALLVFITIWLSVKYCQCQRKFQSGLNLMKWRLRKIWFEECHQKNTMRLLIMRWCFHYQCLIFKKGFSVSGGCQTGLSGYTVWLCIRHWIRTSKHHNSMIVQYYDLEYTTGVCACVCLCFCLCFWFDRIIF